MPVPKHNIARDEWERRFAARFAERTGLVDRQLARVVKAELESWPTSDDEWCYEEPEFAADDNISCWSQ